MCPQTPLPSSLVMAFYHSNRMRTNTANAEYVKGTGLGSRNSRQTHLHLGELVVFYDSWKLILLSFRLRYNSKLYFALTIVCSNKKFGFSNVKRYPKCQSPNTQSLELTKGNGFESHAQLMHTSFSGNLHTVQSLGDCTLNSVERGTLNRTNTNPPSFLLCTSRTCQLRWRQEYWHSK